MASIRLGITLLLVLGSGSAVAAPLAFATNQQSNNVSVIHTRSFELLDTIAVDEYPEGINTLPGDRQIYVANWFSNTVSVIDAVTGELVNTIDVGDGPRAYGNFIAD